MRLQQSPKPVDLGALPHLLTVSKQPEHPEKARPEKQTGLLRASGTVGSMTLISRVLGFVRDMVIARLFGANIATDAFFVAFKIPNFFRRLFAEGAFSQAFVPVFTEYRETQNHEKLRDLVRHVSGTLGAVLLLLSTIGVSAAPLVILVFAPGFADDSERLDLAARMLRLTFPYLFFISMVALAGGILNSFRRFAIPAFTPVLLNVCLIACAIWLSPHMETPVFALAWGAFIAGVVQFLFQLPFLYRLNILQWPRWGWKHPGVQKILTLMLPAMLGSAVVQINLLLDTLIASMLQGGSVSWLYFADRLVEFPLGVFGIAIATVILPSLSQKHATADTQAFSNNLDWALRLSLLIGVPSMLGLLILSQPMLITLFQYGEFTLFDTRMAAYALMAYAVGLPAFILVKILAPAFFARQDTRTPVKIAIRAMLLNMLMNIVFVVTLIYLDFTATHAGLALATACAAWIQTGLLTHTLKQQQVYRPQQGWSRLIIQIGAATLTMCAVLIYFMPGAETWAQWHYWQRGIQLTGLIAAGAAVYFGTLWLSGVRMRHFRGHN